MTALTPRQAQALEHILAYTRRHGYAPSVRDLGRLLGITTYAVTCLLNRLEAKGAITRAPGKSRAMRPVRRLEEVDPALLAARCQGFVTQMRAAMRCA